MIDAVIVSQGDELTTGQIADTNSSWIAGKLWEIGVRTRQVLTVPDDPGDLVAAFQRADALGDVVICTGGLGPTCDDLTAEAIASAFGQPLSERAEALAQIEARFAAWGRHMSPTNTKQAQLPAQARVLENRRGTAPGFAVDTPTGGTTYCLPGVPHEMRAMITELVLPDVIARHALQPPVTRQVGVVMAESRLEEALADVDLGSAELGFRAAISGNLVKLRFPAGTPSGDADGVAAAVFAALGEAAYSDGEPDIAAVIGRLLRERGETIAVAESCTGGQLTARIAATPGCSAYLLEGIVAYSNATKVRCCGVSEKTMAAYGAVSEAVARQLAAGIRERAGADWGLGVTGIAGPDGGSEAKPVGTVHIAVSGPGGVTAHLHTRLPGDRARITARAATTALLLLYQTLKTAPVL
ncbi:MAG: nicotinamide-nucleotide amidase [Myxococcota bacterium]